LLRRQCSSASQFVHCSSAFCFSAPFSNDISLLVQLYHGSEPIACPSNIVPSWNSLAFDRSTGDLLADNFVFRCCTFTLCQDKWSF
jgi:hypothetical protein